MTIWWCGGCGREDIRAPGACPSCGSAMQESSLDWLEQRPDETVWELEPTSEERAAIVEGLVQEGIRHRWDTTTDLVAADHDEASVDRILDDVLGEEGDDDDSYVDGGIEFEGIDDGIPDFEQGSDNGYEVLSQLFIATGRVLHSRDEDGIREFIDAATTAMMTGAPFGVDDETWADIQSAARNASSELEGNPKAAVDADLKGLHNQLQTMV